MFYGNYLVRIINIIVAIFEAILGLRVLFRLFNANPNTSFVNWIYSTSGTLMDPFRGVFTAHQIARGYTLDVSALFAMLMYLIIGAILAALLGMLPVGPTRGTVVEEDRPARTTTRSTRRRA
jgi:uncharacterized protein YggT (Ycf19 family)